VDPWSPSSAIGGDTCQCIEPECREACRCSTNRPRGTAPEHHHLHRCG
jgi:hypothetical protein